MSKKKSCMSLNINSVSYIYAFLLPISCMLVHFFHELMVEKYIPEKSYKTLKYNIPFLFYYFLPKILTITLIPILKSRTRGESIVSQQKLIRRYHFFIEHEKKKQIFAIIYIISFLEIIFKAGDTLLHYLYKKNRIKLLIEKRTGFIIFVPIFSYIILKKRRLYSQDFISLVMKLY